MARRIVSSVEEILEIAREKGMPLEKMRFFIGTDCREPKCFGVYQDPATGEWVVYKNKSDGTRAERYRGTNEALAAQEIWDKLSDEVEMRRDKAGKSVTRSGPAPAGGKRKSRVLTRIMVAIFAVSLLPALISFVLGRHRRGYYVHDREVYYVQDDSWYHYGSDGWVPFYDFEDSWYEDDYVGASYDFEDASQSFEQSDYYVEPSSNDDDDWDDDDWDSWDSGDTDWDSDW